MKMDVVILAAGKGNRLRPITEKTPKSLIKIGGNPVIKTIFDSLDSRRVNNVFIITKHLEDKIKKFVKKNEKNYTFKIKTVPQGKIKGTYGALVSVKKQLGKWFVVINGDDIHSAKDLSMFFKETNQIGICKKESSYFEVVFDRKKFFQKFERTSKNKKRYVATGCYTLNTGFFNLKPQTTSEGEFGIPQTIEMNLHVLKPKVVIEKSWEQLNTLKDLEYLNKKYLK